MAAWRQPRYAGQLPVLPAPLNPDKIEIFEIPYALKMRMSQVGIEIRAAVAEILADEGLLRSFGMSAEDDDTPGLQNRFRAAQTWACEGGFTLVPEDEETEVEPR